MPALLLVMLGGALGAGARHLAGKAALTWWGPDFPWGTLAVNVLGGFLMGLLAGSLARIGEDGEQMRLLLGVGVLGGFTTFSAFSLDVINLMERGDWLSALGYVLASVAGSVAALALGLGLTRTIA
ncbi:fluoride efflux transporter CrcB [Sphingomonas sp.]|jgi:CrcB protein|uniref:fluoride efflux transporter CrcB n=1 Tax=Sphingomonas sp. TaxID=28214 RepID=UPI002ED788C1